ncbi:hypothetical protein DPMN_159770 [Dreissena polymorpha]|uniref:Uncharacterized protein n=1 Tax=Dreissena polymorpha TaxID=45954 RepID=A0A9D4ELK7_DREPO|nr:hypothetical protein DPMN_159770 [Dreissena polymorpha]
MSTLRIIPVLAGRPALANRDGPGLYRQKIYLVERVLVLGRVDRDNGYFNDITVSAGRRKESLQNEQFTSKNTTIKDILLTPPREIQFVLVMGHGSGLYMELCEIMIYRQADCPLRSYSVYCAKQCHCLDGPCDSVTGACENVICEDGWKGNACNETEVSLSTKCHSDKYYYALLAVSSVFGVVVTAAIVCIVINRRNNQR